MILKPISTDFKEKQGEMRLALIFLHDKQKVNHTCMENLRVATDKYF